MSLPTYAIPGDPEVAPFLIEVGLSDAKVVIGNALARSELLAHLPVELLPALMALLSQVGPDGESHADALQVARILGIHPDEAEVRLNRLAGLPNTEQPLVYRSGEAWRLSKQYIVPVQQSLSLLPPEQEPYRAVPKEEIIAQSRERYATPIHEAERLVNDQLGIEPLPEGPEGEALAAMLQVGVPIDVGRDLLATFPLAQIQAQLHWLPKRAARNPARYLVAAIQGDFGPPGGLYVPEPQSEAPEPLGNE
jgi:hypothetical protein